MLGWFSTFYALLQAGPEIISAMIEIKHMWEQYIDAEKRQELMKRLGDAISVARQTKDTTQLTGLVNDIITGKHS